MSRACPSFEAVAQAFEGGGEVWVHNHVSDCEHCSEEWKAFEALGKLGQELPVPVPPPANAERVRTVLLAVAQKERPPRQLRATRSRWALAAVPLAAAAGLTAFLSLRAPPRTMHRGHVEAASHAQLSHSRQQAADGTADEVVRLSQGKARVSVSPLGPKERFRVVVGDAELEVHGTKFEVAAEQDHLSSVWVYEGQVEVRPRGQSSVVLSRGQSWTPVPPQPEQQPLRVEPAAAPASAVRPKRKVSRVAVQLAPPAAQLPRRAGLVGGLTEKWFAEGWDALRAGNAQAASQSFARAAEAAMDTPLGEDARYWEAVALARGGNPREARGAMESFLKQYSTSARAGELSAMLGWILLDEGRVDEAKARFTTALADPSARVRDSAQAGMSAARAGSSSVAP